MCSSSDSSNKVGSNEWAHGVCRLYKDPIEPWPGHDIKPASAEATHQVYLDVVK
jgi:hypothetical protein